MNARIIEEFAMGTGDAAYVHLALAEGMENVVSEYLQYFANAMISFPGAEVARQDDGSYIVTIGGITSVIEMEGYLARGLWRRITRVVSGLTVIAGLVTVNMPVVAIGVLGLVVSSL